MKSGKIALCFSALALLAMLCLTACGEEKKDQPASSGAPAQTSAVEPAATAPAAKQEAAVDGQKKQDAAEQKTAGPADAAGKEEADKAKPDGKAADGQDKPGEAEKQAPAPEEGKQEAVEDKPGEAGEAASGDGRTEEPGQEAAAAAAPEQKPAGTEGEAMKDNNGSPAPLSEKDLLHRRFELQAINGAPYAFKEKRPSIEFNEGFQVSGAVCNGFMGKAGLENGVLSVQNMAATKKLCFEEEINALEVDFFTLLHNGAAIEFDGKRMILRGKGREGDLTLEYEIRDWVR